MWTGNLVLNLGEIFPVYDIAASSSNTFSCKKFSLDDILLPYFQEYHLPELLYIRGIKYPIIVGIKHFNGIK
jgi:hypothetical protein